MSKPRLIDANALKEKLQIADDNWNPVVTAKEIDEMPTAYDIDIVVEQLEDYAMWKEFMIYDLTDRERKIIRKAIEIVKGNCSENPNSSKGGAE